MTIDRRTFLQATISGDADFAGSATSVPGGTGDEPADPPAPAVLPDADKTALVEWLKAKLKN